MKSKGLCWRIAGALKIHPVTEANPGVSGSGNVVNINIKTSNERIALASEDMLLCYLPPTDTKSVDSDARASRHLRSSRSNF
jgi:hypothetical protein